MDNDKVEEWIKKVFQMTSHNNQHLKFDMKRRIGICANDKRRYIFEFPKKEQGYGFERTYRKGFLTSGRERRYQNRQLIFSLPPE